MKNKGFCRFYKDLYFGESVKRHTYAKWQLFHGKGGLGTFCIMRAVSDGDQLDIVNSMVLKQPYYKSNPAYIYGIAGSYNEALDLIVRITEDALAAGYEGRLLDYLESEKKDN